MPVATVGMWHDEHGGLLTNWKNDRLNHLTIYISHWNSRATCKEHTLGEL
jgi:hypothetical protein